MFFFMTFLFIDHLNECSFLVVGSVTIRTEIQAVETVSIVKDVVRFAMGGISARCAAVTLIIDWLWSGEAFSAPIADYLQ
jgi:hypothetical protein